MNPNIADIELPLNADPKDTIATPTSSDPTDEKEMPPSHEQSISPAQIKNIRASTAMLFLTLMLLLSSCQNTSDTINLANQINALNQQLIATAIPQERYEFLMQNPPQPFEYNGFPAWFGDYMKQIESNKSDKTFIKIENPDDNGAFAITFNLLDLLDTDNILPSNAKTVQTPFAVLLTISPEDIIRSFENKGIQHAATHALPLHTPESVTSNHSIQYTPTLVMPSENEDFPILGRAFSMCLRETDTDKNQTIRETGIAYILLGIKEGNSIRPLTSADITNPKDKELALFLVINNPDNSEKYIPFSQYVNVN